MGSIYKNVGKIHVAVVQDKETRGSQLAEELSALAVEAIMGGFGSDPWVEYMSIFADTPAQLRLLTEPTGGHDSYFRKSLAYIVSNAVCAAGTNTATTNNVREASLNSAENALLAEETGVGLAEEPPLGLVGGAIAPDGTVKKPSVIMELLAGLNNNNTAAGE